MYNDQGMSDDQRIYLTDNAEELIESLTDYALSSLPSVSDDIDAMDSLGLSLDDFCDFC